MGSMGKVAASPPFLRGAMPESLRIAGLPFSMSSSICFTASDKDPSATLGMTIKENR